MTTTTTNKLAAYRLPDPGETFVIRIDRPWSGPCPQCGRRKARTRRYKAELPCTDHRPAKGIERVTYRAQCVDRYAFGVEIWRHGLNWRSVALLSAVDVMPGGTGDRATCSGGMTAEGWIRAVLAGEITADVQDPA